ncbi:carbohydrate sulfotransferase 15-like isoform X1 [Mytilus californianus]|uniref:carbohydrate sulfotransferase 15-like isoform X1 n=2 Tax=Mytilus californianus TaxID=6549 RepID=UPI00224645D4|nr:carbohydrate sulfotransferase 15-like isoform X1 [Mytilus californianus]
MITCRLKTGCLAAVVMFCGYIPLFAWIYMSKKYENSIQVDTPVHKQSRDKSVRSFHVFDSSFINVKDFRNTEYKFVHYSLLNISYPFNCTETLDRASQKNGNKIQEPEDILCMKRPKLLENYKNPCWIEDGRLRCLPYFHIFGVCKSGTTDLFRRLVIHHQIIPNKGITKKETWFWSWKRYGEHWDGQIATLKNFTDTFDVLPQRLTYSYDLDMYYSHFVAGHGDPMDIWYPFDWKLIPQNDPTSEEPVYITPNLIYHLNPNIKLILVIRDPVERLYSHYIHKKLGNKIHPSAKEFHEDVQHAVSTFSKCIKNKTFRACLYDTVLYKELRVPISSGFYSTFLRDWLKVFDKDQIMLIRTEDYRRNIAGTLTKVFKFLNLDVVGPSVLEKMACREMEYKTNYRTTMMNESRSLLETFYSDSQRDMESLLDEYGIDILVKSQDDMARQINCSRFFSKMPLMSKLKGKQIKRYFVSKKNATKYYRNKYSPR